MAFPVQGKHTILEAIALLGGINRKDASAEGVCSGDFKRRPLGKWLFKAKGGKTFDGMREALVEYGYMGEYQDKNDLVDIVRDSLLITPVRKY